jgi:tetrapyrrole methylase family protein/MazG family protein
VADLPAHLEVHSFDELYRRASDFEEVYEQIVSRVLSLARRPHGVVYAVPGHPFVAEATAPAIASRARSAGLPVRVVEGLSFLEPTLSALGVDLLPRSTIVDAFELAAAHHPAFPPDGPALVVQLHSREMAAQVKLTLMAVYPDDFPVRMVHAAGTDQQLVEELPLYAIDRSGAVGLVTSLYLPPLGDSTSFESFQEIIAHLRAPEGCPWDREQTHLSLRPYLLEEAYEVLTALDSEDPQALQEELGDLLIQVVLHAQIATEEGRFTMADVLRQVHAKLVYRHPHVFGEVQVNGVAEVKRNWEQLKAVERRGKKESERSLLNGVAQALPALVQADAYQQRAARVGFDWPDQEGVWAKIEEELAEVREAGDPVSQEGEIGDLLFSVVNLSRWFQVDPESALRGANRRFRARFSQVESAAEAQGRSLGDMTIEELEALWQASKKV